MFTGFILWWYGPGWRDQVLALKRRIVKVVDMFSIDLLLKTLFMPFRQISAEQVDGSLSVKMHAFLDKLVSRMIGAVVRLLTILAGILILVGYVAAGALLLLLWPLIPILPFFGAMLAVAGWMPWAL